MHAASVHPEPGSNSRFKFILASFSFYCSLRNCRDLVAFGISTSASFFVLFRTISSLFNFQGSFLFLRSSSGSPLKRALVYYITSSSFCQPPFHSYFLFLADCLVFAQIIIWSLCNMHYRGNGFYTSKKYISTICPHILDFFITSCYNKFNTINHCKYYF